MIVDGSHFKFVQAAIDEAQKAILKDELPIGSIIVYDKKIVARAHNLAETKKNACLHAEILAINKACKKLESKFLTKCDMYTTLEPCFMCYEAIKKARLNRVYFLSHNTTSEDSLVDKFILRYDEKMDTMLKDFFAKLRKQAE